MKRFFVLLLVLLSFLSCKKEEAGRGSFPEELLGNWICESEKSDSYYCSVISFNEFSDGVEYQILQQDGEIRTASGGKCEYNGSTKVIKLMPDNEFVQIDGVYVRTIDVLNVSEHTLSVVLAGFNLTYLRTASGELPGYNIGGDGAGPEDDDGEGQEDGVTDGTISLTTKNIEIEEMFSAIVSGSISGVDSNVEVGVIYGVSGNLSDKKGRKVSTQAYHNFSVKINGLIDDAKYYYRTYAIVDGVYYYGEEKQFSTGAITYSIGDKTFKMIKVEDGQSFNFSMMQTELPSDCDFRLGEILVEKIDSNGDRAVTRGEFKKFLDGLKESTGISFRLPTVDEWTYAACGGNQGKGYIYCGSNDLASVAWYKGNCSGVQGVATKNPNELGLYDMSGNYSDLCYENNRDENLYYGVDGCYCGGNWSTESSGCTPFSIEPGNTSANKIPGTNCKEYGAFDAKYIAVRLIYSRSDE